MQEYKIYSAQGPASRGDGWDRYVFPASTDEQARKAAVQAAEEGRFTLLGLVEVLAGGGWREVSLAAA